MAQLPGRVADTSKRLRTRSRRRLEKPGSGGPRAGCTSEVGCMCLAGASRARARNSPDDVRIRQAVTASLLRLRVLQAGPDAVLFGFPRAARLDWGARCGSLSTWFPARSFSPSLCRLSVAVPVKPPERGQAGRGRTSPQARAAVQPAPPPLEMMHVHQAAADCEVVPVADWTVSPLRATKSASGATLVPASSRRLPHVTATPRRPSPRLDRHVRDPSGDGSARMMARGLEGVEEMTRIVARWRGAHPLPLGGGECEFQHLSVS